jgi:membrane protease YdiL (CAAX protease family)
LEELGWRGFLQPRLQQRYSAVGSSVAIGVLWAVWHAPMILVGLGNFTAFWEYALTIVAVSVIFGWLYNNTGAALPVVMVAHASHNLPPVGRPTGDVPTVFATVSGDTMTYLACAVGVVAYTGVRTLTRDGTVPNVPGRIRRRSSRSES